MAKKKNKLEKELPCPFKSITHSRCHHVYAIKNHSLKRAQSICRYTKSQKDCPLFNEWLTQLEFKIEKDNTINKKISGM